MGFEPILMRDLVEVLRGLDPVSAEAWQQFALMAFLVLFAAPAHFFPVFLA